MKNVIFSLMLVLGFGLAYTTPAQAGLFSGTKDEACSAVGASSGGKCDQDKLDKSSGSLTTTLNNIINIMSIIVGIAAVIMIIVSGFRYITSAGDSNQISSAKNTFIYAIVGLIVVALAQTIVKFVLSKV
ncbi:hypothetical protein HZB74_03575 [Candidatus Saccharibacteria bacterium]|nr:hypothetical protein [Candidatus Saccharibacteria bacterium]